MSTNTTDQVFIDMTVAHEDLLPGDRLLDRDGTWNEESVVVSATEIAADPDSVYLIMTVCEGEFTAGYPLPRSRTTKIQRPTDAAPAVLMGVASRNLQPGDVFERTDEVVTAVEKIDGDPEGVRIFIATDDRQPMAYIRRLTTPALIRRRIDAGHILPDLIGAAA